MYHKRRRYELAFFAFFCLLTSYKLKILEIDLWVHNWRAFNVNVVLKHLRAKQYLTFLLFGYFRQDLFEKYLHISLTRTIDYFQCLPSSLIPILWIITENLTKTLRKRGINCLLTWVTSRTWIFWRKWIPTRHIDDLTCFLPPSC